jgi:uncharacterized protein (UPF0335 family)
VLWHPKEEYAMANPTNGITQDQLEPFMRKIDSFLRDLASERGSYMNTCKGIRGQIKEAIDDAKSAGIPSTALKAALETLKLQRRINSLRAELEADAQLEHDMIIQAVEGMEDLPLGIAAVEREKREAAERKLRKSRKRSEAVDKLTGEGDEALH